MGRQPRFARRAHCLDDDAEDEIEADLDRKSGEPSLFLRKSQVRLQALAGRVGDIRKIPGAAGDERSPRGIALSLAYEGRAACGDSPDGVGDGAPARAGDSFELRRQLRGDRGPEIVEASEVR